MSAPADLPCLKATPGGCELFLQVVPNAGRTALAGLHADALRVRLAAPPIEGRANAALLQWLAKSLGLARREVRLVGGDLSRCKRVQIDCPPDRVATWLRTQGALNPPD